MISIKKNKISFFKIVALLVVLLSDGCKKKEFEFEEEQIEQKTPERETTLAFYSKDIVNRSDYYITLKFGERLFSLYNQDISEPVCIDKYNSSFNTKGPWVFKDSELQDDKLLVTLEYSYWPSSGQNTKTTGTYTIIPIR